MSRTIAKERPLDSRYDPFFKSSEMPRPERQIYRTSLQFTDVSGSDRPLFFAAPVKINLKEIPPEIVQARAPPPPVASPRKEEKPGEKVETAVQTQYRESEAQTDPWLPDTVEHTRPRAWFEEEDLQNLSLDERQKRLVELEVEQWAKREREIVELQQRRLNTIVDQFQKREDSEAAVRQKRVEDVLKAREEKRKKEVERIATMRLKVLRTLTEQRRQMTAKKRTKRDIVSDYSDRGSSAYAPLRRAGRADAQAYMNPAVYGKRDVATDNSLDALDEIEQKYRMTQVASLKSDKVLRRADKKHLEFLETVEKSVKEKKGGVEKKVQTLKIAQRIEKPPPRPPTPEEKPDVEDDDKEMAAILIQRLLRGRALQSEMYRCLENQRQLIRELRTTEALKETEESSTSAEEKEAARSARANREKAATVEGKVVGEMLTFLNCELKRRIQERKIDAMLKLAERERRRREAEESGKREEELKRQAMEDEAFRRIMGVNYETTESYLESIINSSIEDAAEQLATETAKRDAEKITHFTSTAANKSGDESIVARDLVAAFLFPEVEKDSLRKRLRIEQKKFRRAAENSVKTIESHT